MRSTQLYRHFDQTGTLLYVGVSLNVLQRLTQHRADAEWFDRITRIEVAHFANREDALAAEADAIASENPLFNRAGKVKRRHRAAAETEVGGITIRWTKGALELAAEREGET